MRIQSIFNEIKKGEKKEYINSQEFEIDYIENPNKGYSNKGNINSDYNKLYFEALKPPIKKDGDIISKYDNDKIENFLEKVDNDVLMISGDFWGIQKFIFDNLSSSKASKILRSRSAMIQLITYALSDIIKNMFESEVVLFGAGKFLILSKPTENYEKKLNDLQKALDNYFIKNFFGQNGVVLSYKMTTKAKIQAQESKKMKIDLESLGKQNELKKLNKFDIQNLDEESLVIDLFSGAKKDDDICPFCKKRVGIKIREDEKICNVCDNQIKLGEELTKNKYMKIFHSPKTEIEAIKIISINNKNYYVTFYNDIDKLTQKEGYSFDISNDKYAPSLNIPKWPLSSFVAKNGDKILSFEKLQEDSNGLMALKADVDKLGDTFREYYMKSFKKFNRLSRELDFFFSNYVPYLIENNDEYNKKLYVIFAGGDDLFLIGEYKTIIKFAKDIRKRFFEWSLEKATLSMGFVMFKHSTPITYISDLADEAEARAKNTKDKEGNTRNGIDIFGIDMKFDEFEYIDEEFDSINKTLKNSQKDTTSFYYRLIELSQMREELLRWENRDKNNKEIKFNPTTAMWKSKLNYTFQRNLKGVNNEILEKILNLIDTYGQKIQPSIFLTIYKNRDENKKGEKQ